MTKQFLTNSFEETQQLGRELAKKIKNGHCFALYGDLGSGKTTFVQGFAKGLGITKKIISPSFIIVRSYEIDLRNFYHVDLYRIHDEKDIEGLGLSEIINDPEAIVTIEWPGKIEDRLPKKRTNIYFEYIDPDKRKIIIKDYE